MTGQHWYDDDEALLAELRQAVDPDVPGGAARLVADAKACFTWHTVDEELELLTLSHDSSLTPSDFRSGTSQASRMLVFESEHLTVEIQVGSDTLIGQLVPASPAPVVIEDARGVSTETQPDDSGFFIFRRPPEGAVRVRVRTDPELVTQWLPM
jgi:hypothetical protein